ncbi:hypothetical protein Sgleb_37670 [Streptomyces glebosus]|uniref:Uncharacterized protein n=1 Tax=Streptomyces glebosus TaxID=249580 RepID=A0A640SXL7_9ACTN|nr:hypothetical protein Sgleb_37670 [Streptomyces glebosus]GHG52209.1 hypothetical protein GCM10010513_12360 [Streptomyces glebosus]
MSTASSDHGDPAWSVNPPFPSPSLPGAQYVGWGAALHGASVHKITINNSYVGGQNPRMPPPTPDADDSAPTRFKPLARLRILTSRLLVLADRVHMAVEALAAHPQPFDDAQRRSRTFCSSIPLDPIN